MSRLSRICKPFYFAGAICQSLAHGPVPKLSFMCKYSSHFLMGHFEPLSTAESAYNQSTIGRPQVDLVVPEPTRANINHQPLYIPYTLFRPTGPRAHTGPRPVHCSISHCPLATPHFPDHVPVSTSIHRFPNPLPVYCRYCPTAFGLLLAQRKSVDTDTLLSNMSFAWSCWMLHCVT